MGRIIAASSLSALLAGCVGMPVGTAPDGSLRTVPDEILALAAPYQDLTAVVLRPDDGCYWYWHDGPVERTLIPLRTPGGDRICTEAPSATG